MPMPAFLQKCAAASRTAAIYHQEQARQAERTLTLERIQKLSTLITECEAIAQDCSESALGEALDMGALLAHLRADRATLERTLRQMKGQTT